MINKSRLYYLLEQYRNGKASAQEAAEMFECLRSEEGEDVFKEFIVNKEKQSVSEAGVAAGDWERMWGVIQASGPGTKRASSVIPLFFLKVSAAAVIILVIAGAAFLLTGKKKELTSNVSVNNSVNHYKNDLVPGGNKAILTLADGSTIILDSAENGSLAKQGSTDILKINAGQLAYNTGNLKNGQVLYNTISTPRGGQYQVTLADGTIVWLNAASSLHFPTSFAGKERTVELTGEGYFEVAKNKAMPFHVKVNGMDVLVTGTHFDVMAYNNEDNIKTTLLEGKVKVIPVNGKEEILQPGRQAIVNNEVHDVKMINADIDQVMAWKNGYFRFRETNIRDVMRQLERWYDVDVEYKTTRTDQDYTGVMPRMQNASSLLQTLELTGTVHFQIDGKKIIVLP